MRQEQPIETIHWEVVCPPVGLDYEAFASWKDGRICFASMFHSLLS